MTEVQKLTNNKEIIAYLAEKFPRCFFLEGEARPLKIGIFQDLAEALADDEKVSKTQLRQALRLYTAGWRYLYACKEGAERVDLQGNPAGVLEKEHAEHAAQKLAESKAKVAEKRAAERAANPKTNKKPARPNSNKANGKKTNRPNLVAVDLATLTQGATVKVKAGNSTKRAVVLEVVKDNVRVELENGLTISVTAERLFA
ncbi:RNA chaperone ProQ [Avibacterium sp. 21-599]|uniref:RNA chaperone ProQ n=1 Tax=Avibacterium sp. 21-599 TaxID=2911528 RepID=UPI0022459977|nr:RNA chaperone ProQ [Avibacterium sp. 21-599]MCW9718108.1 RNA chaperone ProQ [Avibacterium sp. 21-599]